MPGVESPRETLQYLSRQMTPQQIAEGQRLFWEFRPKQQSATAPKASLLRQSRKFRPKQQSATAPKAPLLPLSLVLDVQRLLAGLGYNPHRYPHLFAYPY